MERIVQPTEAAWAAGFLDGEGCISLQITRRCHMTASVIAVQKDRRPLEKLQQIFGADEKIGVVTRTTWKRPYYRLVFTGSRAAAVLQAVLPYLTLKREVAEVALALIADVQRFSPQERAVGLSPETWAYRRTLVTRARWLNSGRWAAAETEPVGDALDTTAH